MPLTQIGEDDARDAGQVLRDRGLKFDVAFTSNLERAWRTCALILAASGQSHTEVIKSWKLNERHYGILQGHRKNCPELNAKFGEDKIMNWRKSYTLSPPAIDDEEAISKLGVENLIRSTADMDPRYVAAYNSSKVGSNSDYPKTESLKQCSKRAYSYWTQVIAPRVRNGEKVLIVAHANALRSLIMKIDGIDEEQIKYLKIPNGIPLVYTLDNELQPIDDVNPSNDLGLQAKYLVSGRNHPKMMEYERCVRKKMTALFEVIGIDILFCCQK